MTLGMASNFGHHSRSGRSQIFGYGRRTSVFGPNLPFEILWPWPHCAVPHSMQMLFLIAYIQRIDLAMQIDKILSRVCYFWLHLPGNTISVEIYAHFTLCNSYFNPQLSEQKFVEMHQRSESKLHIFYYYTCQDWF